VPLKNTLYFSSSNLGFVVFIRLRRNTLQLAAGMEGKANSAEAH
jgi:hypothetical protein